MHTFYAGLAALPDSWLYVVEPASLEVELNFCTLSIYFQKFKGKINLNLNTKN